MRYFRHYGAPTILNKYLVNLGLLTWDCGASMRIIIMIGFMRSPSKKKHLLPRKKTMNYDVNMLLKSFFGSNYDVD